MALLRKWACALAAAGIVWPLCAADSPGLGTVISKLERRYNGLATLIVRFEQKMQFVGRPPLEESGILYLRRPSKMRWQYEVPEGKLLVGDGEVLHMYSPRSNQVRRVKLEETGDLRAPLSFLLGRLKLRRQFRNLRLAVQDGRHMLIGEGRTGKEAYTQVEFTYDPDDYRLVHIKVYGQDETITTFRFEDEKVNEFLALSLFRFEPPAGADVIDQLPRGEDP